MVGLIVYGLAGPKPDIGRQVADPNVEGDLATYRAIVDRVAAGEWYYDAAGSELRARGYPTASVLNWRLPTNTWFVAGIGEDNAMVLFRLLALGTLVTWTLALRRAGLGFGHVVAGAMLLMGSFAIALTDGITPFHEVWAGSLIALSLALRQWSWVPSVLVAVLAVALRELALAYIVVMFACALFEHRRREAVAWGAVIGAFAVGLAVHAAAVANHSSAGDLSRGWLELGGWPFVLATGRWNLAVLLGGLTVAAVFLPLAVVGAGSWNTAIGTRLGATVGCYVAAFLVVGRPDNSYWGIIYAPLLAISLLFAPSGIRALTRAAGLRPAGEVG